MNRLDRALEDILEHHGVKGMKWDKKKKKDDNEDEEEEETKESSAKSAADAKMVNDITRGDYGNGEERKKKLGKRYQELQDLVNEQLLGTSSKGKSKDKPVPKKTGKKKPIAKKSEFKKIKKKLKPKNKKRSDGLLQQILDLSTDGMGKLFSKFTK